MLLLAFATALADPASAGLGGCAVPRSLAELRESTVAAEEAWGNDSQAFDEATAAIDPMLRCVIEVVPPVEAARVHRLHGLAAFRRRDLAGAGAAFATARALDPEYRFPERLVPEGNPVDTLYRNAAADTQLRGFDVPKRGWLLRLDGTAAVRRNEAVPVVVQVVDPVGRVREGAWVPEHGTLPVYPTWRTGLRGPLLGVGAGLLAVGAGIWTYAAVTRPAPESLATVAEGEAAESRQTVLGGAALGLGAVGLGSLGIGVVVGRW